MPLEGGVWTLRDKFGKVFIPTNMPASLKRAQCQSKCLLIPDLGVVSIYQTGELVKIISFELV